MPRPPVTEKLDLKTYFEKGATWKAWFDASESERKDRMREHYEGAAITGGLLSLLQDLPRKVHILGIAEDWCGDVVHAVPAVARLADESPHIEMRIVERTPELIVRYLTNGAEAIPIFVVLTEDWIEIGHWGPRPEPLKAAMARARALGRAQDAYPLIKEFYQRDRHCAIFAEMAELLKNATATEI